MAEPEVSIIMPVYNSHPEELREAVESALGQTLRNIELVCVDDGSVDDTPVRLDAFAQKDERIRVIHLQTNQGTLAARNAAIIAAKGQYILPLDPDDALHEDACEVLVKMMKARSLDMLQFAVETSAKGDQYCEWANPTVNEDLDASDFAYDIFVCKSRSWGIVKMFRREPLAVAAASFPNGYCANGEDGLLLFKFLSSVHRVGCTPLALYRYRYGNGLSTSLRPSRAQIVRIMRSLQYSLPWLKCQSSKLAKPFRSELLRTSLDALVRSRMDKKTRDDVACTLLNVSSPKEIIATLKTFAPISAYARWLLCIKRFVARNSRHRRKLLRKIALSARVADMVKTVHHKRSHDATVYL